MVKIAPIGHSWKLFKSSYNLNITNSMFFILYFSLDAIENMIDNSQVYSTPIVVAIAVVVVSSFPFSFDLL